VAQAPLDEELALQSYPSMMAAGACPNELETYLDAIAVTRSDKRWDESAECARKYDALLEYREFKMAQRHERFTMCFALMAMERLADRQEKRAAAPVQDDLEIFKKLDAFRSTPWHTTPEFTTIYENLCKLPEVKQMSWINKHELVFQMLIIKKTQQASW